jgi:hypothetical protein
MKAISWAASMAALFCSGCSAVSVHKDGTCVFGVQCQESLPGIPFNVKVPRLVQTTQWAAPYYVVTLNRIEEKGGKKEVTPMLAVELTGTPEVKIEVKALVEATEKTDATVADILPLVEKLKTIAKEQKLTGTALEPTTMIANALSVETVMSSEQHYFNPYVPLIGSSNTTLDLSSDGTLTKFAANIKDETASTLLSLLPIKEYFATLTQKPGTKGSQFALSNGKVTFNLAIIEGAQIYTLKRDATTACQPYAGKGDLKNLPPLKYEHIVSGVCGVQLASVTKPQKVQPPAGGDGGDNKPAYTINGKITLPETKPAAPTK